MKLVNILREIQIINHRIKVDGMYNGGDTVSFRPILDGVFNDDDMVYWRKGNKDAVIWPTETDKLENWLKEKNIPYVRGGYAKFPSFAISVEYFDFDKNTEL